ncbi:hypothetical protein METP2_03776 [Methanosarcinales archaeon]|nr:hypothetical protein [Candidatus Methanoperedens sp.]CAG1006597.1 hypothetical protein METP2_03776 [Methanosarcinales archaeon]
MGIKSFHDIINLLKNTFMQHLNIFFAVALFNIFFFVGGYILTGYTGDLLLDDEVLPGNTFAGEFFVYDIKDITFIFSATQSYIYSHEQLKITIIDPNRNSSSLNMAFHVPNKEKDAYKSSTTFTTLIFSPKTTGKYQLYITGATIPTFLKIRLGMVNVNFLYGWFWIVFWIIVLAVIGKYLGSGVILSKGESLIALSLSIVITYYAIYYFSR